MFYQWAQQILRVGAGQQKEQCPANGVYRVLPFFPRLYGAVALARQYVGHCRAGQAFPLPRGLELVRAGCGHDQVDHAGQPLVSTRRIHRLLCHAY